MPVDSRISDHEKCSKPHPKVGAGRESGEGGGCEGGGRTSEEGGEGVPAVWQGGTEDEEVQRLQAGSVLHGSVPAEGLEEAQEVVQGGGGAEEVGRERELVTEKWRQEGKGCHPFEPSEWEVDAGEAGVGVLYGGRERAKKGTREKRGEGEK